LIRAAQLLVYALTMHRLLKDYRTMLLIRFFEEKVEALFLRGLIHGTAHPAIGQEAVAVGVAGALRKNDTVTSTHRGHGHFLARGGDPRRIMAELFGKTTGYSRGRGGSQLMADYRLGFLGANGITGGSLALATGMALAAQRRGLPTVCFCFFGDGAANQGAFHESLNMAGLWSLPVVYVCENNGYAMSTPVSASTAVPDIAVRAAGYGFTGTIVDGNDVEAVRAAALAAAARARQGEGPTLLECKTYRLSGHSRGDPRVYRSREEEARAAACSPIERLRRQLRTRGLLTAAADRELRREVRRRVADAVAFARRSPDPDPATLEEGVFA
jgi:pyruvate dehydrogenase E1 component alpha subunit